MRGFQRFLARYVNWTHASSDGDDAARASVNFLFRFIDSWAGKRQRSELQSMLAILAEMTKDEIAELVVVANHVRQGMLAEGNDVLRPWDLLVKRQDFAIHLVRAVEKFRSHGNEMAASAFMVWAHTMRGALRGELRPMARQMWRELQRGMPGAQAASISLTSRLGTTFDVRGADAFPEGFDPRF